MMINCIATELEQWPKKNAQPSKYDIKVVNSAHPNLSITANCLAFEIRAVAGRGA